MTTGQVYLVPFHNIMKVHTFRCPLCNRILGKGRIGIIIRTGSEPPELVGQNVTCCGQEISRPETFTDLSEAECAVGRYLRELKQFAETIKTDRNAKPPFVPVPLSQMGLTPEQLEKSVPSPGISQYN